MKYILFILCLFILSCDNSNDDSDAIFMLGENFTMPMNENTTWSYQYTEAIYSGFNSSLLVEGHIDRTVIDIDDTEIENSTDCSFVIENTINTNLIDVPEYDISDGPFFIDQYEMINTLYNDIYYSFYSNDQDSFYSCGMYYELTEPIDGDIVTTVPTSPGIVSIFNIARLDYPLFLGKTWERVITDSFNDPILSHTYEIVAQENIILDINGTLTLFECYKITMSLGDSPVPMAEFYISSEGIIKIELNMEMTATTSECPEGCGDETQQHTIEIVLTDF